MSAATAQHGIGELARLAGVTPRTIRYYVTQGLLPAPTGAGPGAHYGQGHLDRLHVIKRLQRQHLPLSEIRERLAGLSDDQVAELSHGAPTGPPSDSALDYVRAVLGSVGEPRPLPSPAPARAMAAPRRAGGALLAKRLETPMRSPAMEPVAMDAAAPEPAPPVPAAPASAAPGPTLDRSQWERLSLGPNLELHIRRPLSRLEQRRVERLITIARQVLKEDAP